MAMVRKLMVEVVDARNLLTKDGHGTSSPYVVVEFYGQRKRTKTVTRDLNPTWNETLEFNMGGPSDVFGDTLEIDVYHDKNFGPTRRHTHLGRVRFSSTSTQFVRKGEEALMYFPLEKKYLLSWIQGDIGLKIYYSDHHDYVDTPKPHPLQEKKGEDSSQVGPAADTSASPANGGGDEGPQLPEAAEQEKVDHDGSKNHEEVSPPQPPPAGPSPPPEVAMMVPETPAISRSVSTASFESIPNERSAFDLVEKMHYLFVRVVKARSLPTNGCPIVKVLVSGRRVISKPAQKTTYFEWIK